jgi:hypothetical protein
MIMWIRIVVAVAVLVGAAGHSSAAGWERYGSDAMGYTVSIPTDRFALEEEIEGRLSFRQIDGTAQLDVFGVTNPEQLSVAEFQAMMEAADPNREITYRAAGASWFVLSGYLEGEPEPTIFYAKFMLNGRGTALSAFEISYPKAHKAEFNAVVERMEDSLTAPL